MNEKIDIVVMWVDGNDQKWQQEKQKYDVKSNSDASIYRYRDWDLLNYWFRGIEKYAPWANKVFFVTWGHVPEWLNLDNPRLVIVNHKDFIPKKYLPTFSANTIENNLHRINGLSEKFILFNDDCYLIKMTDREDFFKENLPTDIPALNVYCPTKGMTGQFFGFNDTSIINEHFNMKSCIKRDKAKWYKLSNGKAIFRTFILRNCPRFPGFYQHHLPSSFLKSTFDEVWKKEYDILNMTCMHKFRETTDVNQWLFKDWQIASGKFSNRKIRMGESYYVDRDGINKIKKDIINYIVKRKGKMISINDGPMSDEEFDMLICDLKESFNKILPNKSSFEK